MSNRRARRPLPEAEEVGRRESPNRAEVLLQDEQAEYVEALAARRENFCACLDLYKVSYENELPQKCLVHNNYITLYCENESALLCVNCLYGSALHTAHRVVPSKNLLSAIARDNEESLRQLDDQLEKLKGVDAQVRDNRRALEAEQKAIVEQMEAEFKAMRQLLEERIAAMKQTVVAVFARALASNDKAFREVTWWKEMMAKSKTGLPKASAVEEVELYKHLVLALFTRESIDADKLTFMVSGQELRERLLRPAVDLREMLQTPEQVRVRPFF